jgi:hypothetical protein
MSKGELTGEAKHEKRKTQHENPKRNTHHETRTTTGGETYDEDTR